MLRRRTPVGNRGPGLVGTVARTAVIAGTATAASGAVSARQMQRQAARQQELAAQDAQQHTLADLQHQVANLQAGQVQAQTAPGGSDGLAQLTHLAQMRQDGLLTEEEFSAAKARLLGL